MLPTFSLLALGSAALYGAADFIGGLASRRANTMLVVLLSQGAGLVVVGLALPLLPAAAPGGGDLIWGGVAGLTGGIGVALLYRALAIGVMAVIAPVTAVCAVTVPVGVAVLLGERPGPLAVTGILLALLAIVLVSQQHEPDAAAAGSDARAGLGLAFASGAAIGLFFLALARTSPEAGLWPLLAARIVSVLLFAGLIGVYRPALQLSRSTLAIAAGGGVLDMLANLLFLLASHRGPLTLVVTLSSLYPASTVMLARVVFGERLTARQWAGVACALIAIVLIIGGTG